MSKRNASEIYQKKTLKEQILTRPDTYIGTTNPVECDNDWIYNESTGRMQTATFQFSGAVFKIFDEILVNAIDASVNDDTVTWIKVNVDQETGYIDVTNNGQGIPVVMHETEQMWIPKMIFFHLLTSSNYDDDEDRITGGRNGFGAKLAGIFSTVFEVETADPNTHKKFKMCAKNNMEHLSNEKITNYSKSTGYTKVRFLPDYARFGMINQLDDQTYTVLHKRVIDAAACTNRRVVVYWNKKSVPSRTFDKYAELYIGSKSDKKRVSTILQNESVPFEWEVIATVSDDSGFKQVSFVNGINTSEGGSHVDILVRLIIDRLAGTSKKKGLLQKQHKNVEQKLLRRFVKEHLWLFVRATIVNPRFSSQTKEKLTSKPSEFGFKPILTDGFLDKLVKCGFHEKVESYAAYKEQGSIKKTDGRKKTRLSGIPKLDDANKAGTKDSHKCSLILTEGDSAKTLATAGINIVGRDYFGIFPLRGKPLNVKDATVTSITNNEEITHIKRIIGLRQDLTYESDDEIKQLRYGHIVIMADQDLDGSHIKGLLFAMFHHMWPALLKRNGFIKGFLTPVVKAINRKNPKKYHSFYTMRHFDQWRNDASNNTKQWKIKYYKGLGTNTPSEAKEYFKHYEQHLINYTWPPNPHDSEATNVAIDLAFSKKSIASRKVWIQDYDPHNVIEDSNADVSYLDFITKDLIHYSVDDLRRSVPGLDGLKPSQRKIIYGCFKRQLTFDKDEIKVAQLAGYVSDKCGYHHGEESLNGAIINLAQNFTGSNNIAMLAAVGSFGSRGGGSTKNRMGVGKDAASPRYIYTKLSNITPIIFDPRDNPLLTYEKDDDGYVIEPVYYVPIVPTILINGASGIGTGFSSSEPSFNPTDIVNILRSKIKGTDDPSTLVPWYRGFKGIIRNGPETGSYISEGMFERVDNKTIKITELPVGPTQISFNTYKQFLNECENGTQKKKPFLASWDDYVSTNAAHFTLHFLDNINTWTDDMIYERLKLRMNFSIRNMHLFSWDNTIKKYNSVNEIIDEFYKLRLEKYGERKEHMLMTLENTAKYLEAKIRFLAMVNDGTIQIYKKTKTIIESQLEQHAFPKSNNDNTYNYLTSMSILSFSEEHTQRLQQQLDQTHVDIRQLESKTPGQLWLDDLACFEKEYNNYVFKLTEEEND